MLMADSSADVLIGIYSMPYHVYIRTCGLREVTVLVSEVYCTCRTYSYVSMCMWSVTYGRRKRSGKGDAMYVLLQAHCRCGMRA